MLIMNYKSKTFLVILLAFLVITFQDSLGLDILSPADLLALKSCSGIRLSPNGNQILYSVSTPRGPNDSPGPSRSTYWKITRMDKKASPLFKEEVKGSSPRWFATYCTKYVRAVCMFVGISENISRRELPTFLFKNFMCIPGRNWKINGR
jgi:hypothetical protein